MDSQKMRIVFAQVQRLSTLENPTLSNIMLACCETILPAHLSTISVLLPAIAYPLLSPRAAHGLLFYSFFLKSYAFIIQHDLWRVGEPYTYIQLWKPTFAYFCLTVGMAGLARSQYRETQPRHTFFFGVIPWIYTTVAYCVIYVFGILLQEQRKDAPESHEVRVRKFCTISPIILTVICFKKFGRPVSIIVSHLVARRVRWLFRFRPSDIEANANVDIMSYSPADFQKEASEFLWRNPIEHHRRNRNGFLGRADDASFFATDIHYVYDDSRWPLSAREVALTVLVYLAMLGLMICQVYGPKSEKGRLEGG
ncbi:hypothetical protein GGI35DRAFT_131445 [Trichoderma velutinum]